MPTGVPLLGGKVPVRRVQSVSSYCRQVRESWYRDTPSRLHALGGSSFCAATTTPRFASGGGAENQTTRAMPVMSRRAIERARLGCARRSAAPLAAADRARRLDPSLLEAGSIAAGGDGVVAQQQAKQAWTDYLARDQSSPGPPRPPAARSVVKRHRGVRGPASRGGCTVRKIRRADDAARANDRSAQRSNTIMPHGAGAVERPARRGVKCIRNIADAFAPSATP